MPFHELTGDATRPVQTEGNILVAHVVNDRGGWGKGFVLALSKRWPQAEKDYRAWAKSERRGGASSTPFQLGEILISKVETNVSVAHLLAQCGYIGPDNPTPLSYEALTQCLRKLAGISALQNASIHMPRIGAGLGGGDWPRIKRIIQEELGSLPVYIYNFVGKAV
jgi:O-acetyl-ADP-ribose deacetylase (regulator of RNase III)